MAFNFDPSTARPLDDEPQGFAFDPSTAKPDPDEPSLARSAADTVLAGASGLVSGVQMLSNVAGADNAVSQGLGKATKYLGTLESPYRQAEKQNRAATIKKAEESGSTWEEIKAYAGAFGDAPLDTTVNALGTSLPTIGAAFLTGGKSAAAQLAARALPAVMGGAQGAGAVKGQIYEAVENEYLKAGKSPEEAAARATEAQAYSGDNAGQIALGTGLGVLAGTTGAESAIRRMVGGAASKAAGKEAALGVGKAAALGVAKETPIEMLQGGQERVASNLALQNEGFDTPTWQGVAGQAVLEGLASAPMGAGFGMLDARGLPTVDPNAAVEPPAPPPAPPAPTDAPVVSSQTVDDGSGVPKTTVRRQDGSVDENGVQVTPPSPNLQPSEVMGIDPNAGPLSRVAADAVDGPAAIEAAGRQAEQEAAAISAEDNPEFGAPVEQPIPVEERPTDELRLALRNAQDPAIRKTVAEELNRRRENQPAPDLFASVKGAANVSNADAAGAMASGLGGRVGADPFGSGPDAGLLAPDAGQRPAGTAGTPAPDVQEDRAAPVPGQQINPALKKGPTETKAKVGGLKDLIARRKAEREAKTPAGRPGYDTPVEVDAAAFQRLFEQSSGEPLATKPEKLNAWRNGTAKTNTAVSPIEVGFSDSGRIAVNDGRHRIAVAAERGEKVMAFIDGKDAKRLQEQLNVQDPAQGTAPAAAPAQAAVEAPTAVGRDGVAQTGAAPAGTTAVEAAGVEADYKKAVDSWNAKVQTFKAAAPAEQEAMRPAMEAEQVRLEQGRQGVMQKANAEFKRKQAEQREQTRKENANKYGAMPAGTRIGIAGQEKNDSAFWEKTGPDEWTRNGIGSDKPTKTSADMEGDRTIATAPQPAAESEKAKWIKATIDKSRLNGATGVQIAVAPNGGITFLGNPSSNKDGKALLANYEQALAAGATQKEIAEALKASKSAPTPSPTTTEPTNALQTSNAVETRQTRQEEAADVPNEVAAEPNFEAAKALLARQKAATGNAVAEGKLRKDLRDLAAKTPQSDEKTVTALDIAATRLGMGDGRFKGLEFMPAAVAPAAAPADTADSPAARWTRMPTNDRIGVATASGLQKVPAGNVAKKSWDSMDPVVQERLTKAMNKPASPAATGEAPAAAPVSSPFTGEQDPKNSAPTQELDGFKVGDAVDIPSRTFGVGKIETLFTREMAGFGPMGMARVVRDDGKKLDVLTSELKSAAAPAANAPGTRVNGDVERAAADRLELLYAQMTNITDRNSREGNAKAAVRSVIDELRKAKTVADIVPILDGAANGVDRNYGAFADVIREVSDSLNGQVDAAPAPTPAPAPETVNAEGMSRADVLQALDDGKKVIRFGEAVWIEKTMAGKVETYVVKSREDGGNATFTKGPVGPDRQWGWGRGDAAREAIKSWDFPAAPAPAPAPAATKPEAPKVSANTVFTEDAAAAARARLKAKLGRLNSGIDPETLMDGITLAGYHIEKGARTFAAYARAMLEDLGDGVKPYLKSWYMGVRFDPRAAAFDGMDSAADVEAADLDKVIAQADTGAPKDGNATQQLDRPSTSALEGAPAKDVRAPAEGGQAGAGPDGGSRRDGASDSRTDDAGRDLGGSLGGDAGAVPVPGGRTGADAQDAKKRRVSRAPGAAAGVGDTGRPGGITPESGANPAPNAPAIPAPQPSADDFTITDELALGEGGQKTKFKNNVAAIRLMQELESTGRMATPAEQAVLAKYVGWGGLPQAFDPNNADWAKEHAEITALMSPEDLAAARQSTRYAHYTSREIIVDGIYAAMRRFGFNGGKTLEAGAGVGNFIGLMPADMRSAGRFTAIEREPFSSAIARQLYPQQSVQRADFTEFKGTDAYFDAAVGNPPFASDPQTDRSGRKHLSGLSLHNYFFAKSIDMLREGGIMAQVVTNSFMDAKSDKARRYISDRVEFLGAIRLPNNAFSKNAGTEVTTDIIFLQKRPDAEVSGKAARADAKRWLDIGAYTDKRGKQVALNQYFIDNPDMMLGDFGAYGTMYGPEQPALVARPGQDTLAMLKAAVDKLPAGVYKSIAETGTASQVNAAVVALKNPTVKEGGYFVEDGKLMQRLEDIAGEARGVEVTPDTQWTAKTKLGAAGFERIKALATMRGTVRALLAAEMSNDANAMTALRKTLNEQYDAYRDTHGLINDPSTLRVFDDDPDFPLLASLEHGYTPGIGLAAAKTLGIKPTKSTAKKGPIFTQRVVAARQAVQKVETPADALAVSMAERGKLDAAYIGQLLGKEPEAVLKELSSGDKPLLFRDPATDEYVLRDAYLSGNVRAKLAQAREAGMFTNITELEAVQPKDVASHEITARLGSPWVPTDVYRDFAKSLYGDDAKVVVTYLPTNSSFQVLVYGGSNVAITNTWGTPEYPGDALLQAVMNNRTVKVTYRDRDGKTFTDVPATEKANEKAAELKAKFNDWLFADADRSEVLTKAYNETNNNYVTRIYEGSNMTFPGKVPDSIIKFRRHQRNAIARIVQDRTALLDHVVGAGKTFTVISGAMELKRTGLARKPMVAVPNHLVKQWAADFYRLYPGANVLTATKKDFEKANRRKFLAKIATGDWDAVVIAHSSFGFIKPSPEFETEFNQREIRKIMTTIQSVEDGDGDKQAKKRTVKQLEGMKERLENRIKALRDKPMDDLLDFEQIGVDQLFVDEAHMFKNLMFTTKMQGVAGLNDPTGSQRAYDMYVKTNQVMEKNGRGQGVVFATGTPVSNSLAEMYHMMRYLMPAQMKELGFESFDAWANTYASVEQVWMQAPSGDGFKAQNRMSNFVNTPELLKMFDQVSDTVTMDDIKKAYAEENDGAEFPLPKLKGGRRTPVSLNKSAAQDDYMVEIAKRAKAIEQRKGPPKKGDDNILVVMSDARKAAMDIRLVDPDVTQREKGGRIDLSTDAVVERYKKFDSVKGTQLVFSDLGTPLKHAKKELAEYEALQERIKAGSEDVATSAALGNEAAMETMEDAEAAQAELDAMGPDWLSAVKSALRGFSIYDDFKAALIEKGIPEAEIAFIHDYNTDDQKASLFRKVNAGQIRVLLGSTAKLGAGTNVQERLVALHHLDVPWRPSDVEQREGRIERQGNRLMTEWPDFEIEILAYVTKDTLDMRMWQVQETKLKMINQLRTRKIGREIDNAFEDMELSAGEMQAAATGDINLLKEIQLRNDVKKLEQRRRAFDGQRNDLLSRKRRNAENLRELPGLLAKAKEEAVEVEKYRANVRANRPAFAMNIDGKDYTDADEAQAVLRALDEATDEVTDLAGEVTLKKRPLSVTINGEPVKNRAVMAELFSNARGDVEPIAWQFNGETYRRRTVLGNAIRAKVQDAIADESVQEVGTIGAYTVSVEGSMGKGDVPILEVTLSRDDQVKLSNTIGVGDTGSAPTRIIAQAENLMESAAREAAYLERGLERAKKDAAELAKVEDSGAWPDQAKLDAARAAHKAILELLRTKLSPAAFANLAQTGAPEANTTDVVFSQGLLAPASVGPKPTPEQIQRLVDKVQKAAKNVLPVTVIGNPSQVPGLQVPAGAKPTGVLTGGRIYLFSDNIRTAGEAYATLFHELFHLGLQRVIPAEDYAAMLAKFSKNLLVQRFVREWKASPEGVEKAGTMPAAAYDALAAEEALAMVSEELSADGIGTNRLPGLVKAMLSWLANVADRLGLPGNFGDWMRGLTRTDAEKFVSDMVRAVLGGEKNLGRARAKYGTDLAQMTEQTRLSAGAAAQTDTPAFKRWFGDSKVVDADGKPLVVYHGTVSDFSEFDKSKIGANYPNVSRAFYFSATPKGASEYALSQAGARYAQPGIPGIFAGTPADAGSGGSNIMPVYLRITNPLRKTALGNFSPEQWLDKHREKLLEQVREGGYDGIVIEPGKYFGDRGAVYAVLEPTQIKSAIGNNGQFDAGNSDVRFRSSPRELAGIATDQLKMTLTAPGKLSWWSKTVGTMYGLAERNPAFKPVFDAAQSFIDDVSYYGTAAADMAPRILPKLENWRDIAKSPISAQDNKAIEAPVNEGTLLWARDESGRPVKVAELEAQAAELTPDQKAQRLLRNSKLTDGVLKMWQGLPQEQYEKLIESRYESQMLTPGVVWTDAELKSIWKLNDNQIGLYREVRGAIDQSLDNLAKSDLVRFVGKDGAPIKDQIMEADTVDEAALLARDYFISLAEANPDRDTQLLATANGVMDRADKVTRLKEQGYAPLSRFGKYTVDVVTDEGRQYFGLFESMREANTMAVKMKAEFGKDAVSQGTLSDESFKLFQGITPETLELFGNMLGLSDTGDSAQDQAFQAYLKLTKNNRSAMKRLIQRKGILGYSQDVGRVLASFIYSNARQTAAALHIGDLTEAVNAIPQGQGELKDEAVRLAEYIKNPQEEAQAFRGLLFAQYLGGSIASAMVNMTQPLQVSFPYLSQFGGAKQSSKELLRAIKGILSGKKDYEPDLARALKHAEEEGTVSPQEIHQLQAQARGAGTLRPGDGTRVGDAMATANNHWSRLSLAWGKVFGVAEQMNRRSTFIAAYRIAKAQKMADPAAFAKKAVQETQFVYSKANKMRWGRGAIGGVAMTFKAYSVNYLELLHRMATQGGPEGKRAAMLAVAVLLLMGGAGGLPFMEDMEDIADAIAQVMGYNLSTKKAKQEFLESVFGEAGGQFIDRGISGLPGVPLDVSGRLGMGNLIPGTGLFLQKNSNSRDVLELAGPAGDLAQRAMNAGGMALRGDIGAAALELSPVAIRNLAKGIDMANTGMYRDTKGFKVIDSTGTEAGLKAIGFQPNSVAKIQEANYLMQRQKDVYNLAAQNARAKWARGIFERDQDMVASAREEIANWNERNPEQRMYPNMPAIMKRVREMSKNKDQRIADTAPKAMRQQFREETAKVRETL